MESVLQFLQFLRKSGREIHWSLECYISREIIVPCRSCEQYVPIKVIRVLLEPDKAIEFKCNCSQVVGFTKSPRAQTYSPPPPDWQPDQTPATSFELGSEKRVIYSDPVSISSQIYIAETGRAASRNSNSHSESRDDPEPSFPSRNPTSSSLKGKQKVPARRASVSFPERLPTLRDTSSEGSSEYFGEDGSMDGNPRSRQSSVSLPRRPPSSSRHHDTMGFDSMADKPIGRHSWNSSRHSVVGPTHRSYSPAPPIPPIPRSTTPTSGTVSRRSTLNRGSGDYAMDFSASPRLSTESNSSQDWQNLQTNRSSLDFELDQRREPPAPIDRNVSGKRRTESQRSLHRVAVSRRQSIRLENEDESEAIASSVKRRDSMGSDFEVEPSDEQVRHATQIWNERGRHENADIQWARDILRRHKSWRNIDSKYPNPLQANRGSVEQFQTRPDNADEGPNSSINHPQQPHPLTIPVFLGSALGFTENDIPTPVEEEPDSAGPRGGTASNRSLQEPGISFGRGPEPSEFSLTGTPQANNIQEKSNDFGGSAPPSGSGTPRRETTPPELPRPRLNPRYVARRLRRRCRKALKAIACKISSFRRMSSRSVAQVPTVAATAADHPWQDSNVEPRNPAVSEDSEMHEAPPDGPAEAEANTQVYSGEITHDPSEEEVGRVVSEIALTINGMVAPLIELEFEATPLQLGFTRGQVLM